MNKRYLLLAGILVVLGIGMLFMPNSDSNKQMKPEQLLLAIDDPSRFLTTDDITDRLVKKDPALLLIDVRSASEFKAFSIPGAINIPVDSLLSEAAKEILGQKAMDKVFYSNSDVTSDQAWIICKRSNLERMYVMQGGVNEWFNTIVKATKPAETTSSKAMDLYNFRVAACQYFYGSPDIAATPKADEKKSVTVVKKSSSRASGGGC
jgi:rhodanese-related sulfurtransferase